MGKILKYWPKEEIIKALQALPKDKPINKKSIIQYSKLGLICESSLIPRKFGSLKNACKEASIRCDALYGKEKMNYLAKLNTKWNKKNIKEVLIKLYKEGKIISVKQYEKLAKNNKDIPSTDCITHYYNIPINDVFKKLRFKYKDYYWTDKRIIRTLKQLNKDYGPLYKTQINNFRKKKMICGSKLIKDRFKTINNAAKLAGFKFIEPRDKGHLYNGKIGKIETETLDKIEKEKKIKIIRQYRIQTEQNIFFIDGYDKENNIAYEVDEKHHNHNGQIAIDKARENKIIDYLNCEIIRVKV